MNGNDWSWVWPLTHLVTAVFFLLLGWRLGREATGRPMFAYPLTPPATEPAGDEVDPWAVAATGRAGRLDRNETGHAFLLETDASDINLK